MTIQISTYEVGSWKVASLRGRIDSFNDKRVFSALRDTIGENDLHIAVDMSDLDFIGIHGLQELLKLSQNLKKRSGQLALVGPSAQVRKYLEIFAGHANLSIFLDQEELRGGLFLRPRSENIHLGDTSPYWL